MTSSRRGFKTRSSGPPYSTKTPSIREASRFPESSHTSMNWRSRISCSRHLRNSRILSWTRLNKCTEASYKTNASPGLQNGQTRYTRSSWTQRTSTYSAHRKDADLDSISNSSLMKLKWMGRKMDEMVWHSELNRELGMPSLKYTNGTLILFTDI